MKLFKKRIWTVDDFAEFAGLSHWQAKEQLKTYNAAMSGRLLTVSKGANRKYTFHVGKLAKAFPELFDRIDALGIEVTQHEQQLAELHRAQRDIIFQTGQNTRDIAKLKRSRQRAA